MTLVIPLAMIGAYCFGLALWASRTQRARYVPPVGGPPQGYAAQARTTGRAAVPAKERTTEKSVGAKAIHRKRDAA
jgi:hypothetical protein